MPLGSLAASPQLAPSRSGPLNGSSEDKDHVITFCRLHQKERAREQSENEYLKLLLFWFPIYVPMRSPAPPSKWFNLLENSFSYALLLRPCVSVIGFQTLAIDRRTQSVQWASPRRISWTYPCEVSGSVGTCPLPPCPSHRLIESPNKGNTCIGESANRFCLLCLSLTLCARKRERAQESIVGACDSKLLHGFICFFVFYFAVVKPAMWQIIWFCLLIATNWFLWFSIFFAISISMVIFYLPSGGALSK